MPLLQLLTDGDYVPRAPGWTSTGTEFWTELQADDGDAKYVEGQASTQLFRLQSFLLPDGTAINSVTLRGSARISNFGVNVDEITWAIGLNLGPVYVFRSASSSDALGGSYSTLEGTMTLNPKTGLPWKAPDLAGVGLSVAVGQVFSGFPFTSGKVRTSFLQVDVDYVQPHRFRRLDALGGY